MALLEVLNTTCRVAPAAVGADADATGAGGLDWAGFGAGRFVDDRDSRFDAVLVAMALQTALLTRFEL